MWNGDEKGLGVVTQTSLSYSSSAAAVSQSYCLVSALSALAFLQ